MDRFKFTTIAHADHGLCSPISDAKLDSLIEVLHLERGMRVLDLCSGKAEFLIRLLERYDISAVGVDFSPHFVEESRRRIFLRVPDADAKLIQSAAADYKPDPESFDLVVCMGARPFGDARETLKKLATWTRPGGRILIGEGYWRVDPPEPYLAFLGGDLEEFTDHAGNVAVGVELGLTPVYTAASSKEEFDHYEGLYLNAMERYLRRNPEDPDAAEMRKRIRAWRDMYFKFGRDTLGFGLYLYLK